MSRLTFSRRAATVARCKAHCGQPAFAARPPTMRGEPPFRCRRQVTPAVCAGRNLPDCAGGGFFLDDLRWSAAGDHPGGGLRRKPGGPFRSERGSLLQRGSSFRTESLIRLQQGTSFRPERPCLLQRGAIFRSERGILPEPGASFRTENAILLAGSCICVPKRDASRHASTSHLHRSVIFIKSSHSPRNHPSSFILHP